jgi:response regulator RpfG family c-di-GMP phosphodiesterase
MNGIEFLALARERWPDTVRIMLTGQADFCTAIDAVNEGNLFRFLTKPCPPDIFVRALEAGLEQYRLVTDERELLEKTLSGSVEALTDILALTNEKAFGQAKALRESVRVLAILSKIKDSWQLEIAAMLSRIGWVTLPPEVAWKAENNEPLTDTEQEIMRRLPRVGHDLLAKIPRLDTVAKIILYKQKNYDGTGYPDDGVAGTELPLGSRVLRILDDLNRLTSSGFAMPVALNLMRQRRGYYDPRILDTTAGYFTGGASAPPSAAQKGPVAPVEVLQVGHVLAEDLITKKGHLLISAGHRMTEVRLAHIENYDMLEGITRPILVFAPQSPPSDEA